jgi:plastocyanin
MVLSHHSEDSMNTGTSRRLLLLLFMIALSVGCGSGYSSTPSPSAPSPTPSPTPSGSQATTITIPTNARTLGTAAFVPNPTTVSQGTVVTWSNTDSTTHDMVSDNGVWDSGRVAPNDSFKFTFTAKGTYPYHCTLHPGMTGTIVVQ